MDLSSYLLKPIQRLSKYAQLVKQIAKECPSSHAAYADLLVRPSTSQHVHLGPVFPQQQINLLLT